MKLLTERMLIENVAARWRSQYGDVAHPWNQNVHDGLLKLDAKTATAADVHAIIGNYSWTRIKCDACKLEVLRAAVIESGDDETPDTHICLTCCLDAAKLLGA